MRWMRWPPSFHDWRAGYLAGRTDVQREKYAVGERFRVLRPITVAGATGTIAAVDFSAHPHKITLRLDDDPSIYATFDRDKLERIAHFDIR